MTEASSRNDAGQAASSSAPAQAVASTAPAQAASPNDDGRQSPMTEDDYDEVDSPYKKREIV